MRIKLDLLENSQDYVINALELYKIADEYGEYRDDVADVTKKAKWKLAFISMVQALEILLKYGLEKINPVLVYENIDSINLSVEKTVKFSVLMLRLKNFGQDPFSEEEELFIKKCSKYRNSFTHYKVDVSAEDIKSKFAKLYMLYCKCYEFLLGQKITYTNNWIENLHTELTIFSKEYTFYRGEEVRKSELEDIKSEYEKYSKLSYFVNSSGTHVPRIVYGDEHKIVGGEECRELFTRKNCGDCGVLLGEYHLPLCDIEVCPICKGQKLSCNCDLSLEV